MFITKECVGCGFCCIEAKCSVICELLYPSILEIKNCPELIWSKENQRHYCGLMLREGDEGLKYKEYLYENEGCCSNLNSWRRTKLQDRRNS